MPTETDEYDYGLTLVRKRLISYATPGNNIYDRPGDIQIQDSGGTVRAHSAYTYDSYGNLTEETRYTGGTPSTISRLLYYGSYGVLTDATDFDGNATHYRNFTCNSAFPQTILGFNASQSWDCNGGVLTSATDLNSQATSFTYDTTNNIWRLARTSFPDGGSVSTTYTSATVRDVYTAVVGSTSRHDQIDLDGLGRVVTNSLVNDPAGQTYATTSYDPLGRIATVSNPYRSTSDPTYGLTTYSHDALGRPADVGASHAIKYPDGSYTSITYSGNCATIADPAGKARKTCTDALGRVTSVTEDPGQSPHLNYQTTHTYDALNDLTGVTQGSQTRTYNYDMLGRLTSAQTPESGTTSYSYATSANPCSGDPSSVCSRTDARNITTTYAYDALHRLTSKTYSDRTPTASFSYDQASVTIGSWSSGTLGYPKGRMTEATTTSSGSVKTAVVYSYDKMGRTTSFWQCNPSNCGSSSIYNTQYNYDLAGDVTSWVHPGGFTLTNTLNSAQQVTSVQSSWQDSSHPQYLAQNITYTPWGAVSGFQNGCVGSGCLNAQETYQYNNRLQPAMIELGTTGNATADSCLVYNYYPGVSNPTSCATPSQGTTNNGNVMGYLYQDSVQSAFSHTATYTYDPLNRLLTAVAAPFGSGTVSYNLNFNNYDRYGNMTCVQNANTNGPCPQWAYNTSTNQLSTSGFTYDAAGNLTKDSSNATAHTYQWDAEGRVASVDSGSTWSFTYNAVGDRVQWAYPGGADQHLFDPAGGWLGNAGEYSLVKWGDGLLVVYTGSETYFHHISNLGSTTMMTNHSGSTAEDMLSYPWGDVWQSWGSGGYNFAEMPYYDGSTSTNPTMFRFYSQNLGRWHSPDPVGGDLTNPQSLNRYAYVNNNPTSATDPLGLYPCNVNNVSWEGSGTPFPCGTSNDPAGPPDVTITDGSDLSSDLAQAEANWNQTMAQHFLSQCVNYGNCQGGSTGSLWINGVGFQWVPGTFSQTGDLIRISTGYWASSVAQSDLQPCFGGDTFCDSLGNVVRVYGNIESDNAANMAMAGVAYAAWDVSMVQAGRLFGTRLGGNAPVFNSNDYLRVGWSWSWQNRQYGFRLAGRVLDYLLDEVRAHIYLWGGPPR